MKKIIIGILAATAMLFFISCSEGTVENNNSESNSVDKNTNVVENETKETNKYELSKLYDVKLAGDIEGEVFKNNADIYMIDNPECVLRINSSIPESVKIGTKQVMAMPLEDTLYTYSGKEVRYLSEDSNTYYEVGARGKRCMIYGKNGGVYRLMTARV